MGKRAQEELETAQQELGENAIMLMVGDNSETGWFIHPARISDLSKNQNELEEQWDQAIQQNDPLADYLRCAYMAVSGETDILQ